MNSTHRLSFTILLLLLLSTVTNALSAMAQVTFVGEFSNIRHTPSHAYGYSVQLWREDGKVFGFLIDATGLSGDTPIGVLEDVNFNPADGALSFTAKLSIQSAYLGKGKVEPTHDFFSFSGKLEKEKMLVGTLTHVDKLQPDQKAVAQHIRLAKTENRSPIDAETYAKWKESADRISKFRGPKW